MVKESQDQNSSILDLKSAVSTSCSSWFEIFLMRTMKFISFSRTASKALWSSSGVCYALCMASICDLSYLRSIAWISSIKPNVKSLLMCTASPLSLCRVCRDSGDCVARLASNNLSSIGV